MSQSSVAGNSLGKLAIDNDDSTYASTTAEATPWMDFTLAKPSTLRRIEVVNREDCCVSDLAPFSVVLYDQGNNEIGSTDFTTEDLGIYVWLHDMPTAMVARVRLTKPDTGTLGLRELRLLAAGRF